MTDNTKKEPNKVREKRPYVAAALLAAALSFFVFLYAPLEIYFTNKVEFWFDFPMMIRIDLPLFFISTAVIFRVLLLAYVIHKNVYRVLFLAGSIFYFALYMEGTFFSNFLPKSDGRHIDWAALSSHRLISVGIYAFLVAVIVALILIFKYQKTEEVLKYGLGGLSLVLLITLVTVGIRYNGFAKKEVAAVTKAGEFEFSSTQNVIVFLIDAVDASAFERVLANHPEYRENFKDFTYFSNMLSGYTQTNNSVPHMVSGVWDEGKENYLDYRERAFDESPLFDRLIRENYRIGFYDDCVPAECEKVYKFQNIKHASSGRRPELKSFVKNQLELVGYRYAPFDLKRFCIIDNINAEFKSVGDEITDFASGEGENSKAGQLYDYHNDAFWSDLSGYGMRLCTRDAWPPEHTETPCFRWYHIEGGHVPFIYDENMNITDEGSYEQNIAASMMMADSLMRLLKTERVYDNSVIIITADHGFSEEDIVEDRNHPIFMVKGMNEFHKTMQTSDAPVSFEDLQEMFPRLMDGAGAEEAFDWHEGDARDRDCYVYYNAPLWTNVKHVQHGHAGDRSTLERVQ